MISMILGELFLETGGIGWEERRECKFAKSSRYWPIALRRREAISGAEPALSN